MDEQLQAPLRRLAAAAQDQIAALQRAQQRVEGLTVPAASTDGLVRVEVGARGDLRSLWLDEQAYDSGPPEHLAAVITALVREAAAEAARQAAGILGPLLPGGMPAGADLSQWRPVGPAAGGIR